MEQNPKGHYFTICEVSTQVLSFAQDIQAIKISYTKLNSIVGLFRVALAQAPALPPP